MTGDRDIVDETVRAAHVRDWITDLFPDLEPWQVATAENVIMAREQGRDFTVQSGRRYGMGMVRRVVDQWFGHDQAADSAPTVDATAALVDEIDELVDWQLSNYDNRSGYDRNINQAKCPHSWCGRDWHGIAITARIENMRSLGVYDPEYVYDEDNSAVLCPGSLFEGEFEPPEVVTRQLWAWGETRPWWEVDVGIWEPPEVPEFRWPRVTVQRADPSAPPAENEASGEGHTRGSTTRPVAGGVFVAPVGSDPSNPDAWEPVGTIQSADFRPVVDPDGLWEGGRLELPREVSFTVQVQDVNPEAIGLLFNQPQWWRCEDVQSAEWSTGEQRLTVNEFPIPLFPAPDGVSFRWGVFDDARPWVEAFTNEPPTDEWFLADADRDAA